jgi:cell filamentation protein
VPGYTIDRRLDGVLKNKLDATSHDALERLETDYVHRRLVELKLSGSPSGSFDAAHLKAIHRHLFQDVYEWAGHTRDERVTLSDGVIATEALMHKQGGKDFMVGSFIPGALDQFEKSLRDSNYLRGLSRDEFTSRAADVMAEINAIHPFREGNGRTQRVFIEQLAQQAGHTLDFSIVSKERMIQVSIAANENDDPSAMRRLFNEISNPKRVEAIREATDSLEKNKFNWNDYYIATTEPGHPVELTMGGIAGEHFMARTQSDILIGNRADLPEPHPQRGEIFEFVAAKNAWENTDEVRREEQQRESGSHDAPLGGTATADKDAKSLEDRATTGEVTDAKQARLNRLLNTLVRDEDEKEHSNPNDLGRSLDDDDGGRGP